MAIKIQDALKNNEIAIGYLILTYVLTKIISSDDIFFVNEKHGVDII